MRKMNLFLFLMISILVISACTDNNNTSETPIQPNNNAEKQANGSEDKSVEVSNGEEDEDEKVNEEVHEDLESADDENDSMDSQHEEPIIDDNIDPAVVEVILAHIEAVNEQDKESVLDTLDDRYENERQFLLWDYAVENDMEFHLSSMRYYGSNWDNSVIISITLQDELNGAVALWKREDGWKIDNFDVSLSNYNKKEWLVY